MLKQNVVLTLALILLLTACEAPPLEGNKLVDSAVLLDFTSAVLENSLGEVKLTEEKLVAEEEREKNLINAYAAYLDIVRSNQKAILSYWYDDKQVALADIYGDETPELLYITVADGEYEAVMNVYSYEDSTTKAIYSDIIDVNVGGSHSYCLFTKAKTLYAYNGSYNEVCAFWYNRLTENSGKITAETILERQTFPDYNGRADIYQQNGTSSDASTYNQQIADITNDAEKIIWYGGVYFEDTGAFKQELENATIEDEAMSYRLAIERLNEPIGTSIQTDQFEQCVGQWRSTHNLPEEYIAEGAANTMDITMLDDGTFRCEMSFIRLVGFDFIGTIESDDQASLYDQQSNVYGELLIDGDKIIVTLDDRDNFYFKDSLSKFLNGLEFTFTR